MKQSFLTEKGKTTKQTKKSPQTICLQRQELSSAQEVPKQSHRA